MLWPFNLPAFRVVRPYLLLVLLQFGCQSGLGDCSCYECASSYVVTLRSIWYNPSFAPCVGDENITDLEITVTGGPTSWAGASGGYGISTTANIMQITPPSSGGGMGSRGSLALIASRSGNACPSGVWPDSECAQYLEGDGSEQFTLIGVG